MTGVSAKTINREIARGKLKAFRIGRLVRIRSRELQDYMKRAEGTLNG